MREQIEKSICKDDIWADLSEIVAFNSVHSTPSLAAELDGAGAWLESQLVGLGFDVEGHRTIDGSTVYIGTKKLSKALPTVLLYCHYDVVPVNDPSAWDTDPFVLTEKNGRWYGRGAADCKGNIVMHLAALRAIRELDIQGCNITFVAEGSEEMGGTGMSELIARKPEAFRADRIMIADSGNAEKGIPTLTTCLRGGAQLVVTVRTLDSAVHSGALGGPAPDAVAVLVRILDSLKDEKGRTVIDGVNCFERWEGRQYPADAFRADATVRQGVELLGDPDEVASALWSRPAISITGFSSTPVDKAINAVPPVAQANLNLRVPAGLNAHETVDALIAHLKNHTPWGAEIEVEAYDINEPFAGGIDTRMSDCLSQAYGGIPTQLIGSGGSIPLCTELQELFPEARLALYGVEEPTCAIHSINESVDPEEIIRIAVAEALYLAQPGE